MSSPSHPNNHHHVSNSWINCKIDTPYSSSTNKSWSPKNISEKNPDFGPFIKPSSDSSTIPNIKCQALPPGKQITVQHITTSKPDSHVFSKSPSHSLSPHNGNQWIWPKNHQKSHEGITPASSASTHFAKANLYIDTSNRNMTNHQTIMNTNNVVISPNPRFQQPPHLITMHSPQPSYGSHGASDPFTPVPNTPSSASYSMFSTPQLCITGQVQPTTSSPQTLHVSSTTYQTMPMVPQNPGSNTTSSIIHYPAIHINNPNPDQLRNCTSSISIQNQTSNYMPILKAVPSPGDDTRPRKGSLQEDSDYTNALITHQRLRYDKLSEDYKLLFDEYKQLEEEIEKLNSEKNHYSSESFPPGLDVVKLRNATINLRMEIGSMATELDAHNNGLTPIGVTDPQEQLHFYNNMNTGQSGSIFATSTSPQPRKNPSPGKTPPPRPPRYTPVPSPLPDNEILEDTWSCSACTYMNHQALDKCEICEFPRKHKAN